MNGPLERYSVESETKVNKVTIKESSTLKDLIEFYGFIKGELGVILINDKLVTNYETLESIKLNDGDEVKLFPIFGGG
ncbi:MoaD/ThiS family protein [Natranaerofaba carboxydovora]|uniref:MoaD/ThiS family protein n=1 Tax=Natranaerofaba carboxydovora TaxID=2742683 RepID=UPI001F12E06D|nr:MoaD/ThiS family protein [Natranaerofaba carboxydovora]UMZ73637.1 ThiS family protein [Natranaerofaba carboxydovora]